MSASASARLQALVREIGARLERRSGGRAGRGSVLIVLPEGEQHTLGRDGAGRPVAPPGHFGLHLQIGTAAGRPAAAGAGAPVRRRDDLGRPARKSLTTCRQLVQDPLKAWCRAGDCGSPSAGPAVWSGASDVRGRTGADIVTSDPSRGVAGASAWTDAGAAQVARKSPLSPRIGRAGKGW